MPKDVSTGTDWTCEECGSPIWISFGRLRAYHRKNNTGACKCRQKGPTYPEKRIYEVLSGKGLTVIQQHGNPRCRDKKTLPFDAYIPSLDLYIEYDGKQHYDREYCEERYGDVFDARVEKDYIKSVFADHKLIRIPFWDTSRIEEILDRVIFDVEARRLYQEEVKQETVTRYPELAIDLTLNVG